MDEALVRRFHLSPNEIPDPDIEAIPDALVAPMSPGTEMAYGVFSSDGRFCEPSRTLLSAKRFSAMCGRQEPEVYLPGRHLFAGIGRHHFGHFLLECVCRLWPLHHDRAYDGIVIVPKQGINFEAVFQRRFATFLDLLTDGLPVYFATQPIRVEALDVPTQGNGHLHWAAGTERFRHFVRSQIEQRIAPEGPDLLYVSRTQLKRQEQMVDQEARIEALMKKAGYHVFHPQKHSLEEQCARYRASSHIVGADGSAFHLAPFAMKPGTTIGLIQRRRRPEVYSALTTQIRAFCDVDLVKIDALVKHRDPSAHPKTHASIDFDMLKTRLEETGLI